MKISILDDHHDTLRTLSCGFSERAWPRLALAAGSAERLDGRIVARGRLGAIRGHHSPGTVVSRSGGAAGPGWRGHLARVRSTSPRPAKEPAMNAPVPTVARLDLTTAQEVMHAGVVACDPASPLAAVAWSLADGQIHCVVVRGIERARDGERLTWGP
jgi:hypothetical protein